MPEKVLLIGTLPQTAGVGGVTIHIDRLLRSLKKEGYPIYLCDYKATSFITQVQTIMKYNIIHIHASNPLLRLFYVLVCAFFNKKSVLTIHGDIGRFSFLKNYFDRLAITFCSIPILINLNSFIKAKSWNKHSKLLSVFIPPIGEENLPDFIINWINYQHKKNKSVYATNASGLNYTVSGEEIYGILPLLKYFKNNKEFSLIISDPSGQYEKYNDRQNNILFISNQHSFFEILKLSDGMIRATATDGDSISVKESLYLGKQTIATDRVIRPRGVILFKYGDLDSLDIALHRKKDIDLHKYSEQNTVDLIKEVYSSFSNK